MKKSTMMLLTLMSVMMFSCKDKDLYDPNAVKPGEEQKVANTFDFSTVQDVMLTVDYSAFNTHGPVFFSIYHENPFVGEGEDEHLDENIKPIYEDYTDKSGRFNQTVELPAYAKHLYVVTGNFFVTERLMETDVQNGGAKATAKSAGTRAASRAVTRRGAQTNDVSKMPQLSFNVDDNGNKIGERVYQDWQTPLGTWDDRSGAPSYLIDKSKVDQELIFSDEDREGLYATVSQVLNANRACRKTYRDHEDLVLDKASEVTITMLGGSTCWNSSLGYYYYEVGKEPTDTKDLNIIMLFPNTQDGNWTRFDSRKNDYNGNIGVNRGDAIQLMYYPNIADGDLSVVSNVFPANTKIGFILKSHGWGMQGEDYVIKGFAENDRKYNVWGASTPGLSYCKVPAGFENKKSPYQYPNPDGDSRSAKFAYKTVDGGKYAIVSFEDACNDEDYDDVIFALKPIDAFKPLPEIESDRVVTEGVYAFEDLWPAQGDYDMNDVVVRICENAENSDMLDVTLCATGAALNLYVYLDDQMLFSGSGQEVHQVFGKEPGSFINTVNNGIKEDYVTTTTAKPANAAYETADVWIKTPQMEVHVSKQGEDPHGIVVPGNWRWPREWQCIKVAYPNFIEFAKDASTTDETIRKWYQTTSGNPVEEYPYNPANESTQHT